jgi:hydrogenase expression/formation protein HypC
MCLAIPGEVVSTDDTDGVRYAEVRFGGVTRHVCIHVLPDVALGDFVLVHAGFAIAKIDRASAERALQLLADLGDASDELEKADE